MAYPRVTFNATTGSDTQASGAGPATALYGTANAYTSGASTTIILPGATDLSGVLTDGTHVIWLKTTSGREFSVITGKNETDGTVTVEDSFTISSPGVDWAIGGKRSTIDHTDSRTLFGSRGNLTGAKDKWTIVLETNQTLTSALGLNTDGYRSPIGETWAPIVIRGETTGSDAPFATVTQTANAACFNGRVYGWRFENLRIKNSNASKTSARGIQISSNTSGAYPVFVNNCRIGDATDQLLTGIEATYGCAIRVVMSEIAYCTSDGIKINNSGGRLAQILFSYVHHNTGNGINVNTAHVERPCRIAHSIISENSGNGVRLNSNERYAIFNCTIHGNTGDGIEITSGDYLAGCMIFNNCFTANGGYGVDVNDTDGGSSIQALFDFNCYGSGTDSGNVLGTTNNQTLGENDLEVDPEYADPDNADFTPGTSVRAKGFPKSTRGIGAGQTQSYTFVDIGAVQRYGGELRPFLTRRRIR